MAGSGRGRGGYAPRRGRGGWSRPFIKRQEPVKPDLNKHPLGELLLTVRPSDLRPSNTKPLPLPHINDCQYVTSYNWVAGKDSTILVPGQPPRWSPLKVGRRLREDSGTYYRDPNAARYPKYPVAPAVQAIVEATGDTPIDADVFACGSTLGNLLRFTRGIDKAFRFIVEVVGDTVFLVRKENDPKELIEGVHGFGHSFPDAYTTWPKEAKGSETHQRIIRYDLGGLQCLVRFECDGFLEDRVTAEKPGSSAAHDPFTLPSEDVLSAALSESTLIAPGPTSRNPPSTLNILKTGISIPQAAIFDLKTRTGRYKKEINMDDITPQLWLKQVPNFIVAYHDGAGLFQPHDIHVQDAQPLIRTFEEDNGEAIYRLVTLLHKIIDAARTEPSIRLEVYCPSNEELQIRKQVGDGVHVLPSRLYDQWVAKCDMGGFALEEEDTGSGAWDGALRDELSDGDALSDDGEMDFTACSVEECGYCGRCTY
ncbi:geranylgeranyl pyrophosphate synthetase [Stagonosporopsis vannaccii]|nr:geranylgeranyl pyrophosphate synthetase [Stagonosporopsis vannaccii]